MLLDFLICLQTRDAMQFKHAPHCWFYVGEATNFKVQRIQLKCQRTAAARVCECRINYWLTYVPQHLARLDKWTNKNFKIPTICLVRENDFFQLGHSLKIHLNVNFKQQVQL